MAYLNHLHHQQQQQQQQYHHQHHAPHPYSQNYGQQHDYNNNTMMGMPMDSEEDRMEARQAEELLDSDSRHELQLPNHFLPCPNTVIVGRGKKVAQHAGNVRFRELVKKELTEYSAATTKAHKSSIIVRVLSEIRHKSHYAFVKQNLTTGRWYRVEETAQRITTAQAFRDALKDNYKSSRAFKKLKREEEKTKKDDEGEKPKAKKERKKAAPKEKKKPPARPKTPPRAKPKVSIQERPQEGGKMHPVKANNVEDMFRDMLNAQQSAAMVGGVKLWNQSTPKTPADTYKPRVVPKTASVATPMQEDKKMPPPSAIPSNSITSCSSLLWSEHTNGNPFQSNHSRKGKRIDPFSSNHSSIKWASNHSIGSIMTISGHSTRSTSTIGRLVSKFAPSSSDNVDMSLEPRPIPSSCVIQEDCDAMDMELDESEGQQEPKQYVPKTAASFDEGIAMGLGNLSDHSLMSNMSSVHSVKGFTAEEIFADSNSMHGSNRENQGRHSSCPPASSSGYRHMGHFSMTTA